MEKASNKKNLNTKNKRRFRLDIIASILSVTLGKKENKTAIIYKANLNSNRTKKYLPYLISKGLLAEKKTSTKKYTTTKTGIEFLQAYEELKKTQQTYNKEISKIRKIVKINQAQ